MMSGMRQGNTETDDTIFMRAVEVGENLGVTATRVYQLVNAGLLPGFKRGKRTMIPRRTFEVFVERVSREALIHLDSSKTGGRE